MLFRSHQNIGGWPPPLFRRRQRRRFFFDDADDRFEDRFEIFSSVGREGSWDVLKDDISWLLSIGCFPHFLDDPDSLEEQIRSRAIVDSGAFASN